MVTCMACSSSLSGADVHSVSLGISLLRVDSSSCLCIALLSIHSLSLTVMLS